LKKRPRPTRALEPQKKKKKKKKKAVSYFKVTSHPIHGGKRDMKNFGQDNRSRKADSDQRFTE
jgi:hypothetical protein